MGLWIPGGLKSGETPSPLPEIVTWSEGTDEQVAAMLEAHYDGLLDIHDYWAVGDTRTVSLSAMSSKGTSYNAQVQQSVTYVLSHAGGKYLSDGVTECAFQVDQVHSLKASDFMNAGSTNSGGWKSSPRRDWCNNVYANALPNTLKGIFKEFINQTSAGSTSKTIEDTTDTFALRAEIEVLGSTTYSYSGEGTQVDWYKTSSNRKKWVNGSYTYWWERSPYKSSVKAFGTISNSGTAYWADSNTYYGMAPFGCI